MPYINVPTSVGWKQSICHLPSPRQRQKLVPHVLQGCYDGNMQKTNKKSNRKKAPRLGLKSEPCHYSTLAGDKMCALNSKLHTAVPIKLRQGRGPVGERGMLRWLDKVRDGGQL